MQGERLSASAAGMEAQIQEGRYRRLPSVLLDSSILA